MARLRDILRRHRRPIAESSACLLAIAVTYFIYGGMPKVRFVDEVITMRLTRNTITMVGIFHYRNPFPFPVSQGFSLPTPRGDGMEAPHAMSVTELDEKTTGAAILLPLHPSPGAPLFSARFGAHEDKRLKVEYSQKYGGHTARYILTTAGSWKRPLEAARYILQLGGVSLRESNYELARAMDGDYAFERQQFMPTVDWRIEVSSDGMAGNLLPVR
jgi:hypothetical protein